MRLVQIDSPEVGTGECYSRAAARELRRLLPAGTPISLEADPRLDAVDRYGRLLRYVRRDGLNVNIELVRRGAATVWFYDRARGRYAERLLAAARTARAGRRACGARATRSGTRTDPPGPRRTRRLRRRTRRRGAAIRRRVIGKFARPRGRSRPRWSVRSGAARTGSTGGARAG
ncbi:MAG: thermonuclease family protein [Gaiellaceae bacterium]